MEFIVQEPGQRADVFLAQQMPQFSRSYLQKLCDEGRVQINGIAVKAKQKLNEGQHVTIDLPQAPDFSAFELPIVYEDTDVTVINKPAGVLTHAKGAINNEFTVAEFMRPRTTDQPESNRPGIVHRLDRDTSGLIIAAKTNEAKRWLQKQFTERKVKKTYLALVEGHPKEPTALLQLPIERNPKKPQTFRVGSNGKSAETAYKIVQNFTKYTLLQLKPLTGRTHQLRVHMHYLGCPIVGDRLYGSAPPVGLERMFLHASELELTLPSRERKIFTAPLPPKLTNFIDSLQ